MKIPTTGPWSVTDEKQGSFYIRDSERLQLYWLGASSRFESGENEANAYLIAAAPEMLNVLKTLLVRAYAAKRLSKKDMEMIEDIIIKAKPNQ